MQARSPASRGSVRQAPLLCPASAAVPPAGDFSTWRISSPRHFTRWSAQSQAARGFQEPNSGDRGTDRQLPTSLREPPLTPSPGAWHKTADHNRTAADL